MTCDRGTSCELLSPSYDSREDNPGLYIAHSSCVVNERVDSKYKSPATAGMADRG